MKSSIPLFLLLASYQADAYDFEVDMGVTRNTITGDGVWWQKPFPHSIDRNSPSLSVGMRQDFNDGFYIRGGYSYLGKWKSDSLDLTWDYIYDPSQPTGCRNNDCWPLSNYKGSGNIQGLYFGTGKEYKGFSFEVGLYIYRSEWKVKVPDWRPCRDCQTEEAHFDHKTTIQDTAYLSVGYKNIHLERYSDISARGDEYVAVYKGPAWRLVYRWRF